MLFQTKRPSQSCLTKGMLAPVCACAPHKSQALLLLSCLLSLRVLLVPSHLIPYKGNNNNYPITGHYTHCMEWLGGVTCSNHVLSQAFDHLGYVYTAN